MPVGLRFHALHHLFPSLPYHNLAAAHARLMAALPADSPYRRTVSSGLWTTIRQLWREAGATRGAAESQRPSFRSALTA
jgi:fatty acid desaturase